MIKNYMEIIVDDTLKDILEKEDLKCKCEICRDDIKAITLNNLEHLYVATERGILYTKLNEFSVQFKTDVIQELLVSIEKVKKNPRH